MLQMNAIIATGYGGPEVFKFAKRDIPLPKDHEVLVRVYASTVTRADTMMRTGKPLFGRLIIGLTKPKYPTPGTGFAGVVESVGYKVKKFKAGDRVFGETAKEAGTNAEFVAIPENGVILHKPEELSFTDAATYTDGPLTSMNFLKEVALIVPGQKVLVNGASGSLGTAAVQLAKYFGAEVTAVSSHRNIGMVKGLGADEVIDYTKTDPVSGDRKYDVIYDTVGTLSYKTAKKALAEEGQFISPVLKMSVLRDMLFTTFFSKQKVKFAATGLKSPQALRPLMEELVSITREGKLQVITDRQYPLEKVADAHRYIDSGRKKGNVIIVNA
jgi:NADPH:quinone reductase-like Zn-dependent oxidoreductase